MSQSVNSITYSIIPSPTCTGSGGFSEIASVSSVGDDAAAASYPLRRLPLAGGEGTHSILSHLAGAHSIGEGIIGFFTMRESNVRR